MSPEKSSAPGTVSLLVTLAIENTDESWGKVDDILTQDEFCDQPEVLEYATENGLYHPDPNVWDLSASLIAKAKGPLNENTTTRLRQITEIKDNPNATYARFRSAFALFEHGFHDEGIVLVINDALLDDAVSDIAKNYLQQI